MRSHFGGENVKCGGECKSVHYLYEGKKKYSLPAAITENTK